MIHETVLTFDLKGLGCGLYTEIIPLQELGRLHIERATTIEFDDSRQQWVVCDASGSQLFHASTRQDCLDWERVYFNQKEKV